MTFKVQAKLCLLLAILSLNDTVKAQEQVAIQTAVLAPGFRSAYILSHTDKNEIFDKVHLTAGADTPDFVNINVPEKSSFHSITILTSSPPDNPEYYHNTVACHTIWNNQLDTVTTLGFSKQPSKEIVPPKKIDVKITVEGVGKPGDVYSLSTRGDLTGKVTRLNKEDIEINYEIYNTVGQLIYISDKKSRTYKEVVIHPEGHEAFSQNIRVRYNDLAKHAKHEILNLHTNDRVFVQINANTTDGSVYNLYSSPRSLEELDGLSLDLPLNLKIIDYDVAIISRDLSSPEAGYGMASSRQTVENLADIVLPQIIDVTGFVTGDHAGYSLDLTDTKFDKWVLQYTIEGLARKKVSIPWEFYRSSNWFIYGTNKGNTTVFLPVVTEEINADIFGDHGYLSLENDSWSFINDYGDNHQVINAYRKEF